MKTDIKTTFYITQEVLNENPDLDAEIGQSYSETSTTFHPYFFVTTEESAIAHAELIADVEPYVPCTTDLTTGDPLPIQGDAGDFVPFAAADTGGVAHVNWHSDGPVVTVVALGPGLTMRDADALARDLADAGAGDTPDPQLIQATDEAYPKEIERCLALSLAPDPKPGDLPAATHPDFGLQIGGGSNGGESAAAQGEPNEAGEQCVDNFNNKADIASLRHSARVSGCEADFTTCMAGATAAAITGCSIALFIPGCQVPGVSWACCAAGGVAGGATVGAICATGVDKCTRASSMYKQADMKEARNGLIACCAQSGTVCALPDE